MEPNRENLYDLYRPGYSLKMLQGLIDETFLGTRVLEDRELEKWKRRGINEESTTQHMCIVLCN